MASGPLIRVVLAEDQALVRGALRALIELTRDIRVVAEAGDGREAVAAALAQRPEVALLDIEMPEMSGLEAAAQLRARLPECRVAILTTFARPGYLRRALELGVHGYLLKDRPAERLADDIRRIARGERVIDPALALAAWDDPNPLSEREREVLRLVEDGLTNEEIALALHLSPGTVRNYVSTAMQKLGAPTRIAAARLAAERGWLY